MRRVFAIALAAASLGGCSSMSSFSVGDYFRSTPPTIPVQLESQPPGADAKTSIGPGCKTPCSVQITAPDSFSVTFTLPRYQIATVQVVVTRNPGDFASPATTVTDPNPVFAELQPEGPPPKPHRGTKPKHVKKPKPAAAAPARQSPFPDPGAAPTH